MRPRIDIITLGVSDLDRALRFYRDGLGLTSKGIVGTEFPGDANNAAGATAMFELEGGLILAVYPDLAEDGNVPPEPPTPASFSIGHFVSSREEVDGLLRAAKNAGATITDAGHGRPWGIYSGYFQDPDGHLWEIIWNPQARTAA